MPSPVPLSTLLPRTIETDRLILHLFDYSDAHWTCLLSAMNSPAAHERMGDYGIRTPAQLDRLNRSARLRPHAIHIPVTSSSPSPSSTTSTTSAQLPEEIQTAPDCDIYYLLTLKPTEPVDTTTTTTTSSNLMGAISLAHRFSDLPPDIGWCLLEAHHGAGFASEAAAAMMKMVRETLGVREIMAWPGKTNMQSQAVARRIGLVEGSTVKAREVEGGPVSELLVFGLPGMVLDVGDRVLTLLGDDGEEGS